MQRDGQGKMSELPGNRRVAACRRRSKPGATNTSRMEEHSESREAVMKEDIGAMSDEGALSKTGLGLTSATIIARILQEKEHRDGLVRRVDFQVDADRRYAWRSAFVGLTSLASLSALSAQITYQPTSISHRLRPKRAAFTSL